MSTDSQPTPAHILQLPSIQKNLRADFNRFDYVRDVRFDDSGCEPSEFAVVMEDNTADFRTGEFKIELNIDKNLDNVTVEFARPGRKLSNGDVKVIFNLKHAAASNGKTAQWDSGGSEPIEDGSFEDVFTFSDDN